MKKNNFVFLLVSCILILLAFSYECSADTLSSSPYAKIEYSYSSTVTVGTVRYIQQNTGGYFNSNYWGSWASQSTSECFTADISMALSYIGINKTPSDILNAHKGETVGSGWGESQYLNPGVQTGMNNFVNGNGKYSPVIIHLPKYSSKGHFLLLVGKKSDTVYQALDPWNGSQGTVYDVTISGSTITYYKGTDTIDGTYQYYKSSDPDPDPDGNNYSPQSCLDSVSGGAGTVTVRGWTFDRDDLSKSLDVHVYIGGVVGSSSAEGYAITANTSRPDVDAAYSVGSNHGFDATITTTKRGTQKVYLYAIDPQGGTNPLIGSGEVTITDETTPPVISDVNVTKDINGYTVTCTVTDDSGIDRVQFPTWTTYNNQDDLAADWQTSTSVRGTISGNKVEFYVKRSDHNNEIGKYITDIYAYDKFGNVSSTRVRVEFTEEEVNPHTHSYSVSESVETTCAQIGYQVFTCDCGDTYTVYDTATYSEWSEEKPDDINENLIQEQTEYRYRTYETTTVKSTSELSGTGWEQTGTNTYWSSYGSWSDWQDSEVSSSDSTKVETRTVYRYYYFLCPVCGGHEPFQGTSDCHQYTLTLANGVTGWFTIPYSQCNGQTYSYTTTRRYTESLGDGQRWNFSTSNINDTAPGTLDDGEGAVIIKTQYRYCTRSKVTEYTYRRATGWSDWTTDNSNFPSSAATESRTMYRYVTSGLKDHTRDEGVVTKEATCLEAGMMTYTCEVCGDVVTEEIPATGHVGELEVRDKKEATEDEEGYTGDVYCADCGTLLVTGEVIEKLPPSNPQIVTQPVNYEGLEGSTASFTVEATGDELTYQWQYSPDYGKNWYNSSTKQATYSIVLSSARNNRLVRCIITNAKGYQTISDAVSMAIVTPVQELKIVTQPTNYEGAEGSKATFSVKAEGESLTYQWQYSDDRGNNWYNSSGRSADFSIELTAKRNNRYMRCVIKDASGNEVTTDTVSMKIVTVTPTATPAPTQTLRIVTQPVNYEGVEGSKATFTVEAEGESLTYQWQYSDNKGANWYNSSTKTANFSIELTAKRNNRYMRCIVKDAAGNEVTTNTVTMKIVTATPTATPTPSQAQELRIVTQPVNYVGAEGSKAAFTVKAEGESLTYQWQYSDDQGSNWYNSSTKTADFSIELTTRRNGRYMRCIIKDASGSQVITNEVSMKIGTAAPTATPTPTPAEGLRIVTQPVNYEGAEGSKATFTVVAEGEGLTYQWQYSDNKGKNWYNSSTKTAKFEIELTSRRNGRYMRCVITDTNGNEVITNEVTMKISELLDTTASAVMSGDDLLLDADPSEVMLGEELLNSETELNSETLLPELSSDLLDDGSEMELSIDEEDSTGDFELSDGSELGF